MQAFDDLGEANTWRVVSIPAVDRAGTMQPEFRAIASRREAVLGKASADHAIQ